MKLFISILLTALLSFVAGIYLPWWSIAIVSFIVALLIKQSISRSFIAGFAGIFILWIVLSAWIDINNHSILSHKVAQLFSLGSSFLLIIVTSLIGALVGGFAAMSGSSLISKAKYE